jgi:hypothetical protein
MLAILGTIISGVLGGGATGLLGVVIQRFFDYKNRQADIEVIKLNHQNALELAALESERAKIRADADVSIAERDAIAREDEAAGRSLVASYEHDKATYLAAGAQKRKGWLGAAVVALMALVDFARGMLRPGLTMYLTVLVTIMFGRLMMMLETRGHVFDNGELLTLLAQIVATILYCFTTCVVWWFGGRPPKKAGDT